MQGSRAGLLFPFEIDLGVHFIPGCTVRPPDCENDSICQIHLMKGINWLFKMEGKRGKVECSITHLSIHHSLLPSILPACTASPCGVAHHCDDSMNRLLGEIQQRRAKLIMYHNLGCALRKRERAEKRKERGRE